MADPRIPMKNRYLAAVLAYLVPGAGHLYQGRVFKGTLYFVCIVGAYLFGLSMSQWKAVYFRWDAGERNIAYFAQAGVGMFAIPAYAQARRFAAQANELQDRGRIVTREELPISAIFHGELNRPDEEPLQIKGRIEIRTEAGDFGEEIRGKFIGQSVAKDGKTQSLELDLKDIDIDVRKMAPGSDRKISCGVIDAEAENAVPLGEINGAIPRSFINHFAMPLSDRDVQDLNRDLGKFYELAKIFTWIAGLLNILAVWDALEGPAYGYGDEEESTDDKDGDSADESASKEAAESQREPDAVAIEK